MHLLFLWTQLMSLDIQLNGLMNFLTNKSRYPNSSVNRSALKANMSITTSLPGSLLVDTKERDPKMTFWLWKTFNTWIVDLHLETMLYSQLIEHRNMFCILSYLHLTAFCSRRFRIIVVLLPSSRKKAYVLYRIYWGFDQKTKYTFTIIDLSDKKYNLQHSILV